MEEVRNSTAAGWRPAPANQGGQPGGLVAPPFMPRLLRQQSPSGSESRHELVYFEYARKSSEDSGRQVLSIESQIKARKEQYPGLVVRQTYLESKSAFVPYLRPRFDEMVQALLRGEANGLVAWHPNRLSRNEIDAATIVYLIRTGVIQDLKFTSYDFHNTPEGIQALQNLMAQSQYESAKQGREIRRGMTEKVSQGQYPHRVPPGYLNSGPQWEKGTRFVSEDEERLPLVEQAWRRALTGLYTKTEIYHYLADELGLVVRRTRRTGGSLKYNQFDNMIRNVFYTGYFAWKGQLYRGSHRGIITLDEYHLLQEIMHHRHYDKSRRTTTRNYFEYGGLFRCGNCGFLVTATEKRKYYRATDRQAVYLYYHCTHKRRTEVCRQPPVSSQQLTTKLAGLVGQYRILPEFRDAALDFLRQDYASAQQQASNNQMVAAKQLAEVRGRLDRLIDMRADGEIAPEDFRRRQEEYKQLIAQLQQRQAHSGEEALARARATAKVIHDLTVIRERFETGDRQLKRHILLNIGSNWVIHDRMPHCEPKKWLAEIQRGYAPLEAAYLAARTSKSGSVNARTRLLATIIPSWWSITATIADLIEEDLRSGGTFEGLFPCEDFDWSPGA